MDIKKINIKKKIVAGTALAVMSGFIPPMAIQEAEAGTAAVPITVQIVTAVNLNNITGLNFGRLALTGAATGNDHTLSPLSVTTTAGGFTVALAGTPGGFDITAGTAAASVNVSYAANIVYAGTAIVLNRITLAGNAFTAPVQVAGGGTAAAVLVGGGNSNVLVGGRLNFVSNPANGNYNGSNASITIVDIP